MSLVGLLYDVLDGLWADAQVADARGFLADMYAASLGVVLEFVIVDDEQKVVSCDVVVEGGADQEGDVDLEGECAYEFVVGHILAIDGCLQGLIGEDVHADVDIDRVWNGLSATWHEEREPCLERVFEVGVGDVFSLDVVDAPINVLGGVDVNGVGQDDGASLVTSSGGGDVSIEEDGYALVLSVGVEGLNLAWRAGLVGHALRLLAQDGASEGVSINGDFARLLVDVLEVDDEFRLFVAHELVVEGVPAFTGVSDVDLVGDIACEDDVVG